MSETDSTDVEWCSDCGMSSAKRDGLCMGCWADVQECGGAE